MAPSAVVAVTVIVDGPVGVGVILDAVVHPTSAPTARTSRASVRYIGARRNCAARWRTAPSIPIMDNRTAAISHSEEVGQGLCRPLVGPVGLIPEVPLFAATALMVMMVLAEVVPCAIVDGLGEQVAPVNAIGNEHVMVTSAGSFAPDGVRFTFICNA